MHLFQLSLDDYLKKILNARVYDVAKESPLEKAHLLSKRLQSQVFLKREDLQGVFSFKCRGAYNKMTQLSQQQLQQGVICASAGNHAQGVAQAASKLGCTAHVVMPTTTPRTKVEAVRRLGGHIVLHGEIFSEAFEYAKLLQQQTQATFIHPFDDPDVIAGQGTVAMEILRQHQTPIDAVFVAIGGGGLISGVAAYIKAVRPSIKVIGVQSSDSDAMVQSVRAQQRIKLENVGLFSDGTAVQLVGEETFRMVCHYVDDFVVVDTDEVCAAIKDVFEDTRSIVEPAGALAVAGLKKYALLQEGQNATYIAITSGANMNFDRLRFVAERAEAGEQREALFAITIPEARGSFKQFCQLLDGRNVTEFHYRIADTTQAYILVGLQITAHHEINTLLQNFAAAKFNALNLSDDELTKLHLRHMIGGHSPLAQGERLFRFTFPERPGALMKFLASMAPQWNISLFNYRDYGADYGRILIGIQVPPNDDELLAEFLLTVGYPSIEETQNPAYRFFL